MHLESMKNGVGDTFTTGKVSQSSTPQPASTNKGDITKMYADI